VETLVTKMSNQVLFDTQDSTPKLYRRAVITYFALLFRFNHTTLKIDELSSYLIIKETDKIFFTLKKLVIVFKLIKLICILYRYLPIYIQVYTCTK